MARCNCSQKPGRTWLASAGRWLWGDGLSPSLRCWEVAGRRPPDWPSPGLCNTPALLRRATGLIWCWVKGSGRALKRLGQAQPQAKHPGPEVVCGTLGRPTTVQRGVRCPLLPRLDSLEAQHPTRTAMHSGLADHSIRTSHQQAQPAKSAIPALAKRCRPASASLRPISGVVAVPIHEQPRRQSR